MDFTKIALGKGFNFQTLNKHLSDETGPLLTMEFARIVAVFSSEFSNWHRGARRSSKASKL